MPGQVLLRAAGQGLLLGGQGLLGPKAHDPWGQPPPPKKIPNALVSFKGKKMVRANRPRFDFCCKFCASFLWESQTERFIPNTRNGHSPQHRQEGGARRHLGPPLLPGCAGSKKGVGPAFGWEGNGVPCVLKGSSVLLGVLQMSWSAKVLEHKLVSGNKHHTGENQGFKDKRCPHMSGTSVRVNLPNLTQGFVMVPTVVMISWLQKQPHRKKWRPSNPFACL